MTVSSKPMIPSKTFFPDFNLGIRLALNSSLMLLGVYPDSFSFPKVLISLTFNVFIIFLFNFFAFAYSACNP